MKDALFSQTGVWQSPINTPLHPHLASAPTITLNKGNIQVIFLFPHENMLYHIYHKYSDK